MITVVNRQLVVNNYRRQGQLMLNDHQCQVQLVVNDYGRQGQLMLNDHRCQGQLVVNDYRCQRPAHAK